MSQILPDAIERYLAGLNRRPDPVLAAIAAAGEMGPDPMAKV